MKWTPTSYKPAFRKGWTDDINIRSLTAARIVQAALVRSLGYPDLGLDARADITGFNWSDVPVILPELGFMTNAAENRVLTSAPGERRAAAGLCRGIVGFLTTERRLPVTERCGR